MPTLQSHTHLQAAQADTQAKTWQRVCLFQRRKNFKIFFPPLLKKLKHPTRKPTRQRQLNSTATMVYRHGRQNASW